MTRACGANGPRLVAITDATLTDDELVRRSEQMVGVAPAGELAIQLRARDRSGRALLALAERLRLVCERADAPFYLNDRVDVARAVGASGVHLGRASIAVNEARALLGASAWVSRSAHTLEDVAHAAQAGADAVLLSPIFSSPGKGPAQGTALIAAALQRAPGLRIIALGGIDIANARACAEAGAHGVAVIRALFAAGDPAGAAVALLSAYGH